MPVPNQKVIRLADRARRDKNNIYATINMEALRNAMNSLHSEAELKLWLYLDKNANGYSFDFSPSACSDWGISRTSCYRAFEGLLAKGYLKPEAEGSNVFLFYENPLFQSGA